MAEFMHYNLVLGKAKCGCSVLDLPDLAELLDAKDWTVLADRERTTLNAEGLRDNVH